MPTKMKMMKLRLFILSTAILLSILSLTKFVMAAPKQQEEPVYVANFNYTPPAQETPGSAEVTFAIADVNYQSDSFTPWLAWPQFANLDAAIKRDLPSLLTAKGFNLRGPFASYDLMPYQDKKATDLYVIPTLEISVTNISKGHTIKVKGKFTLVMKEIITGELMWSKTVPLSPFEFPETEVPTWVKGLPWDDIVAGKEALVKDMNAGMKNEMAKGIEKQYPELISTIAKLIDPEEMRIIKKQCQELKGKKGY